MNNFKMKGRSITQGTDGHKAAVKKNTIGTGFMNPPYKKPVGPTEKRSGYHGYKNFDSNIEKNEDAKGVGTNIKTPKVMKDGPKKNAVMNGKVVKGGFEPHQFKKPPPNKFLGKMLKSVDKISDETRAANAAASPNKAVCAPGGKSNKGGECGDFKVRKKGTVVSRLANKAGKKVKNTTKKLTKSVANKVKKIKKNRRLNKDDGGSNKTVRYL